MTVSSKQKVFLYCVGLKNGCRPLFVDNWSAPGDKRKDKIIRKVTLS